MISSVDNFMHLEEWPLETGGTKRFWFSIHLFAQLCLFINIYMHIPITFYREPGEFDEWAFAEGQELTWCRLDEKIIGRYYLLHVLVLCRDPVLMKRNWNVSWKVWYLYDLHVNWDTTEDRDVYMVNFISPLVMSKATSAGGGERGEK